MNAWVKYPMSTGLVQVGAHLNDAHLEDTVRALAEKHPDRIYFFMDFDV